MVLDDLLIAFTIVEVVGAPICHLNRTHFWPVRPSIQVTVTNSGFAWVFFLCLTIHLSLFSASSTGLELSELGDSFHIGRISPFSSQVAKMSL